jgi:hypothetical protein
MFKFSAIHTKPPIVTVLQFSALVQLFPPTTGGVTDIVSKFAVTVTAFAGMVNVVVALVVLAKLTPLLVVVQFLNVFPLGAVPAVIETDVPAA